MRTISLALFAQIDRFSQNRKMKVSKFLFLRFQFLSIRPSYISRLLKHGVAPPRSAAFRRAAPRSKTRLRSIDSSFSGATYNTTYNIQHGTRRGRNTRLDSGFYIDTPTFYLYHRFQYVHQNY